MTRLVMARSSCVATMSASGTSCAFAASFRLVSYRESICRVVGWRLGVLLTRSCHQTARGARRGVFAQPVGFVSFGRALFAL